MTCGIMIHVYSTKGGGLMRDSIYPCILILAVGAIVGGMILGVLQSLVTGYLNPALADVIPYIVLLLILIIKPYGLFGLVRIERL